MKLIRLSVLKLTIFAGFVLSSASYADGYQELTPASVFSGENGDLYIVMNQNIGANGCVHDKNSVLIKSDEQSPELVKTALSITLSAIATTKNIKVYWSGCLSGGRPKATLVGFGSTEIN